MEVEVAPKPRRRSARLQKEELEQMMVEEAKKPIHERVSSIYIGTETPEERKRIFLQYFSIEPAVGDDPTTGPLHRKLPRVENPYEKGSWYNQEKIEQLEKYSTRNAKDNGILERGFRDRYIIADQIVPKTQSITKPILYNIVNVTDYFEHLLYERKDLFMKLVPLHDLDDDDLDEIYNEVMIAYFLNELVYGYSGVLSLHFMTIVDWFIAPRKRIVLDDKQFPPVPIPPALQYHQVIVSEKIDLLLENYLSDNPRMEILRVVLFQLYQALEVAWHTNRYTHNDLHLGNLMLKIITPDSPLFGKDFLYRRLSNEYWYKLSADLLDNKMLKIIDFGRNRCWVRRDPPLDHPSEDYPGHHKHARLIFLPGMESLGNLPNKPNQRIDIICSLLHILAMKTQFWEVVEADRSQRTALASFYDLCTRAISFSTINEKVQDYISGVLPTYKKKPVIKISDISKEANGVGGVITARNYRYCPQIHYLMKQAGIYIYSYAEPEFSLQEVLDHPFFAPYMVQDRLRRPVKVDENEYIEPKNFLPEYKNFAIVSFVQHREEAEMKTSALPGFPTTTDLCCSVCKKKQVQTVLGNELYCGMACFEFKNYFQCKTVFR
jgi:hypothetical protein